jgi:hypothetical protein
LTEKLNHQKSKETKNWDDAVIPAAKRQQTQTPTAKEKLQSNFFEEQFF